MLTTLLYDYNASDNNVSRSNTSFAGDDEDPLIYNIYVWLVAGVSYRTRFQVDAYIRSYHTHRYLLGQQ